MTSIRHTTALGLEDLRDLIVDHYAAKGVRVPFGEITFELGKVTRGPGCTDRTVAATMKVDTASAPLGTPSTMTLEHDVLAAVVADFLSEATGEPVLAHNVRVDVDSRPKTFTKAGYTVFAGLSTIRYQNVPAKADAAQALAA